MRSGDAGDGNFRSRDRRRSSDPRHAPGRNIADKTALETLEKVTVAIAVEIHIPVALRTSFHVQHRQFPPEL